MSAKCKSSSLPVRPRRPLSRRSRRLIYVVVAAILLGLVLADRLGVLPGAVLSDQARYHGKSFSVVKVVDGDTIDLDVPDPSQGRPYTRVRLWGVDTPETRHPERGVMYYGREASQLTTELVGHKRVKVVLEPFEKSRGRYGRLLAYIYLPDDTCLNEELLRQGCAYADERFSHMLRTKFIGLQKQARREERGLWKDSKAEQWPDWFRRRHDPDYRP